MKKSFSLLELILVIFLISFIYTTFIPKKADYKLKEITHKISLYLSYLRYQALIDDKYDLKQEEWFKKRWTLKFFNCNKSVGGIYFVMYSDKNMKGHPNQNESLKDPLTNKYIYSSKFCKENPKNSKYVLLTKNYDIKKVEVSCNNTSGIGQISFGSDGKIYTKLSKEKEYQLKNSCHITFINKKNQKTQININKNGYKNVPKM